MINKLVIVGAGGHGQAVTDMAEMTSNYESIFFVYDIYPE